LQAKPLDKQQILNNGIEKEFSMTKKIRLHRRTLLRGAAGATLALPVLECMLNSHGTAFAAGEALPTRLVVFFFGNGVLRDNFRPGQIGANWELSETLEPLAAYKNYLNIITGYDVKVPNRNGHHNGTTGVLAGYDFSGVDKGNAVEDSRFDGPSIDQAVGFHRFNSPFQKKFKQGKVPQPSTSLTKAKMNRFRPISAPRTSTINYLRASLRQLLTRPKSRH